MAAQYLDFSSGNSILREFYKGNAGVADLTYTKNPVWGLVQKHTDGAITLNSAGGKYYPQVVKISNSQGRSNTFGYAQSNQTAAQTRVFQCTYAGDYAVATVDAFILKASGTDAGAFIDAFDLQIDGNRQQLINHLAACMFQAGTGVIGAMATGGASSAGVVTPLDPNVISQIEKGQCIICGSSDGTTNVVATPQYVISVDRNARTFTLSASQGGTASDLSSTWAQGATTNYFWIQGDNAGTFTGLAGWLPTTAPASNDSFFGVNRSTDTRLSGYHFDATASGPEGALAPEDQIVKALTYGGQECVDADYVIMSYTRYGKLISAIGSKVMYVDVESDAGVGFKGVKIFGPDGEVTVLPDRNCPQNIAYALKLDTWKLVSLGDFPMFVNEDGNTMLRAATADAFEVRMRALGALVCSAPNKNMSITLP